MPGDLTLADIDSVVILNEFQALQDLVRELLQSSDRERVRVSIDHFVEGMDRIEGLKIMFADPDEAEVFLKELTRAQIKGLSVQKTVNRCAMRRKKNTPWVAPVDVFVRGFCNRL
ncbi:MAG: hypothetical protein ABIH35_00295 [Patescibacteria group bacterium]